MQFKTIQPMTVFCFETETTMKDLLQYVRVVAQKLYADAAKNSLEVTGPVYWIYNGADGQPETTFLLTIALPVSPGGSLQAGSEFVLKSLETFHCLSAQHNGDWGKLGETYAILMSEIQSKGHQMNGLIREAYINMDFQNPEANITEVQIGLIR